MPEKQIKDMTLKEILRQQLELIAEQSKNYSDSQDLLNATRAIVELLKACEDYPFK